MDPEELLRQVESNITKTENTPMSEEEKEEIFENALDSLRDYRLWRKNGGFEPPHGDIRLVRSLTRIAYSGRIF